MAELLKSLRGPKKRIASAALEGLRDALQEVLAPRTPEASPNFLAARGGNTPLHITRYSGCTQALLDAGANPFITNKDGELPVVLRIRSGDYTCAERLIDAMMKTDVESLLAWRETIISELEMAKKAGHKQTYKFVMRKLKPIEHMAPRVKQEGVATAPKIK